MLDIRSDAPQVVVSAAFYALAAVYRPDLNADPDAARCMVEVNDAYAEGPDTGPSRVV